MPNCSKCGKQVNEEVCPYCQTPVPGVSLAKEAVEGENIYEGLTAEEVVIFNQYLRLVQGGWLEVAAVDRLSTDHKMDLEEIKSIIKRGLKALQRARERAQKEAQLKAKQLARDAKKNARQAARDAKKALKTPGGLPAKPSCWFVLRQKLMARPRWLWPLLGGLLLLVAGVVLWFYWSEEQPQLTEVKVSAPSPPTPAVMEKYSLRDGRVACYQQADIEAITQVAASRQRFEQILASGRCFVNRSDLELEQVSGAGGNLIKAFSPSQGWIYFHRESLQLQIINKP